MRGQSQGNMGIDGAEDCSTFRERIDVRCRSFAGAVNANVIRTQRVDGNQDNGRLRECGAREHEK